MVIDARTYLHTVPEVCVLSPPDVRFVLTQKKLSQRSSMSVSPRTVRSILSTPLPENMDRTGRVRSVRRCRGDDSAPTSSLTRGSMCVVDACLAYSAAISAPWLVPPTQSTGTPESSRARSAPRCASPWPPPPVNTTPTA